MFKFLFKKLTKNHNEIPLFTVTFNLNKYKQNGVKGSCDLRLHPDLKDKHIEKTLNDLVDYIRSRYVMDKLIK
jgi:hypothetical protein